MYCCSASSCLVLFYLVSCPLPSCPLKCSPLFLDYTTLKNTTSNSLSPRQTNFCTMKPTRIDSQTSLFPIYHFSICPVPQATLASVHNHFKPPPLGLCYSVYYNAVLIKPQTGTPGFGSQRSSKKATLQK